MSKRKARAKTGAKTQPKRAARRKPATVADQRFSNGERDPRGRFVPGNTAGFQPGQSGNPAGRRPGRKLSEAYSDLLDQPMPANLKEAITAAIERGDPVADILALAMASHVLRGKVDAAAEMRKATEGNRLKTEWTGKDGSPLFPGAQAIDLSGLNAEELEQFTANVQTALDHTGDTETTQT